MAETVETAIYRLQVEGAEQIVRLTEHVDNLAIAEENATASTRKLSQRLQTDIARGDETVRGLENIRKALESYERYAEAGIGTQQQLAAYYEVTNQKVAIQTAKLQELAVATENARRAQANLATGAGQTVQKAGGAEAYAAQFAAAAKAQDDQIASINRLRAAMNPLEVEQGKLAAQMNIYKQALQEGKISQAEYAAASEMAGKSLQGGVGSAAVGHMNQLGNSTKAARYEMINLGRQAQDVVVSLYSGQGLLTVMVQQGSQILDVFISSEKTAAEMFKQIGTSIGSFLLNPLTLAIGVVTALSAAVLALANSWDKAQVASQRALTGVGARSGTTVADINAFVERNAAVSGTRLSGVEARELANAFTAGGKIVVSELDDMSNAVIGFAKQTGKSTKEASDLMVQFANDPIKGMEELEKVWGDFDVATRNAVRTQVDARNNTAAFNIMLRATAEEAEKAAKNMTVLERAQRLLFSSREQGPKPTGIEDQVAAARGRVEAAMNAPVPAAGADQAAFAQRNAEAVRDLEKAYEELFAAQQKLINQGMTMKMNELSKAVGVVEQSIIPQIAAIEKLTTSIKALEIAKAKGVVGPHGAEVDTQALEAAKAQRTEYEQSQAAAARIVQEVNKIADAHKNVSRETAKELNDMEQQLKVTQAVGVYEKQNAQYAKDLADAKTKGGKTETEAVEIADAKRKESQAQINTQAELTLRTLQNQEEALRAVGGAAKAAAKEQETFLKLSMDAVKTELAAKIAAQERTNAYRQVNAAAEETLHTLQAQLPVIEAIGGAAKMAAQEQATFNRLVRDNVSAERAAAVAAAERKNAQAAADAQSKEKVVQTENETRTIQRETEYIKEQTAIGARMTGDQAARLGLKQRELEDEAKINESRRQGLSLEQATAEVTAQRAQKNASLAQGMAKRIQTADQEIEMAKAITHADEMRLQFQRTYNALRAQGATHQEAELVAQKEFLAEQEKINKEVQKEITSLNRSTEMIYARVNGEEAAVAAAQAYADAIDRGASSTVAAAKAAAVLANEIAKVDAAAISAYNDMLKAVLAKDEERAKRSLFEPRTMPTGPLTFVADPRESVSYRGGGTGQRLSIDMSYYYAQQQTEALARQQKTIADALATYDQAVAKAIAERNPAAQLAAYQGELGYVQGLAPSTENYQKIASLQDSIANLTKSTDDLSGSTDSLNKTNQDLLSPYYTQDPRTSHIGFRSQGMALGGYVDVPGGYSSNDNMLASIPVASGERIYVDPMGARRGTSANGSPLVINISSPITINGPANADQFGRTVYQNNQQLAKQVRAATQ